MEISTEESKIMASDRSRCTRKFYIQGQQLKEVTSFKYLGSTVTIDGKSMAELNTRIAQATATLSKLNIIWKDKNIQLAIKIRLLHALVLSSFLYGCETWTLTVNIEMKIEAMEMRCYRRLLCIPYIEHTTNDEMRSQITSEVGEHDSLLQLVKHWKLEWFGHTIRRQGLANTFLQGTVAGKRKKGRPTKSWIHNIKEWTRMSFKDPLDTAKDHHAWRNLTELASKLVPQRPH
nr:PREDICTED: uncharacterized protein LOC106705179 [Latimeria chalumnae]|eukprot:XP_014349402.1 PREDICTED: uncharacterized protein LOC106705179 [Latimeria chalumnae]